MITTQSTYCYSTSSCSSSDENSEESPFDPEYTESMPQPSQELIDAANQLDGSETLLNQLILYIGMGFEPTVNSQLDYQDGAANFQENYTDGNGLPETAAVMAHFDTLWSLREEFVDFYWSCLGGSDSDSDAMSEG